MPCFQFRLFFGNWLGNSKRWFSLHSALFGINHPMQDDFRRHFLRGICLIWILEQIIKQFACNDFQYIPMYLLYIFINNSYSDSFTQPVNLNKSWISWLFSFKSSSCLALMHPKVLILRSPKLCQIFRFYVHFLWKRKKLEKLVYNRKKKPIRFSHITDFTLHRPRPSLLLLFGYQTDTNLRCQDHF